MFNIQEYPAKRKKTKALTWGPPRILWFLGKVKIWPPDHCLPKSIQPLCPQLNPCPLISSFSQNHLEVMLQISDFEYIHNIYIYYRLDWPPFLDLNQIRKTQMWTTIFFSFSFFSFSCIMTLWNGHSFMIVIINSIYFYYWFFYFSKSLLILVFWWTIGDCSLEIMPIFDWLKRELWIIHVHIC